MNERILELAKQAGLKFPSEEALSPVEIKFAEWIVKDVFAKIKESCVDTEVMGRVDEVINDRLNDAASEICDDYSIVDRIY
jgi:hypothetical protein